MKKIIFSLIFFALSTQAEMVDTFPFHNDADRLRAVELAKSLRCPQCQNQNLVESIRPIAYDLRLEVYNMVNDGKSNDEIMHHMTDVSAILFATIRLLIGLPCVVVAADLIIWPAAAIGIGNTAKGVVVIAFYP